MTKLDCALSVEVVNRLIKEIRTNPSGSTQALKTLTDSFHDLIHWQAHKCKQPELYEDLLQEGYLALVLATNSFDTSRKVKFSTFVTKCIRHRMLKLAMSEIQHVNNTHRTRHYPEDKNDAIWAGRSPTTLDELHSNDWSERAAVERLHYDRCEAYLGPALEQLSERQQQAVILRFFDDQPPSRIAIHLGVSRPRITALIHSSLRQLRVHLPAAA